MGGLLETVVPDNVWVARAPFRFMGLVEIGTRMTVLRCGDGHHDLVIHSPIAISPELKAEIDALGTVRYVIAPSLYHHVFAGEAIAKWPNAKLLAPVALRKKRKDLRIDYELESTGSLPDAIRDAFELYPLAGTMLGETAFFHRPTKTLVTSDLFENFTGEIVDHAPTRLYLKLGGIYKKPGWHRLLRIVYRDKKAAGASVAKILDEVDFDRVIVAHGEIVTDHPKDVIREALSFLLR